MVSGMQPTIVIEDLNEFCTTEKVIVDIDTRCKISQKIGTQLSEHTIQPHLAGMRVQRYFTLALLR